MKKAMIVLLIAVHFCGCWPSGCAENYSNGSRVGYVRKLSEKGLIWKSWEGEMMLTAPAGVMMANVDTFSFSLDPKDTALVRKINEAMISGERTELTYHQYFISPWWYSTSYLIADIKRAVGK